MAVYPKGSVVLGHGQDFKQPSARAVSLYCNDEEGSMADKEALTTEGGRINESSDAIRLRGEPWHDNFNVDHLSRFGAATCTASTLRHLTSCRRQSQDF